MNEGIINYLITNLILFGLLGYKVICPKKWKTFHSKKCFCFCKIHIGCLLGSCFYECVQTVWKLLRKSFYDFVIFHLVTALEHIHFKKKLCFISVSTNQQVKRRFGRFSLESLRHPIEAGFIFSLICPLFILLSLLDNADKPIFSETNKVSLFAVASLIFWCL